MQRQLEDPEHSPSITLVVTWERGRANRGPSAIPTADSDTNRALALVRSFRATYIAMYLRFTALADPACREGAHYEHKQADYGVGAEGPSLGPIEIS